MAMLVMDPSSWTALFQAITPLALAVLAFVNWKTGRIAKESADKAAVQVNQVKTTLQENGVMLVENATATRTALETITGRTEDIHTLVNSNMGKLLRDRAVILRASAINARRLAEMTKSTPEAAEDLKQSQLLDAAAKEAELSSTEHDSKQAVVDSGKKTTGDGLIVDKDAAVKETEVAKEIVAE